MRRFKRGRRIATVMLVAGMALGACSNAPEQQQGAGAQSLAMVKSLWANRGAKPSGMPQYTRAQIDAATLTLLLVEIESDGRGTTIGLANSNAGVQTFATGDSKAFMFRDGVLVATRDIGVDLMSSSGPSLAHIRAGHGSWKRSYQHLADDDQIRNLTLDCAISKHGNEQIIIAERGYSTQKFVEECISASYKIRNEYWVDGSGKIRQSRQWIGPDLGMLRIADPM